MNSEKELFEDWFASQHPSLYRDYINRIPLAIYFFAAGFEGWQASRNREDYVLVPVYMIENAIDPPCEIDKEVAERELLDMIGNPKR